MLVSVPAGTCDISAFFETKSLVFVESQRVLFFAAVASLLTRKHSSSTQQHKFLPSFASFLRPHHTTPAYIISGNQRHTPFNQSTTMNPTTDYLSSPRDTASDRLDSILSAALSPEFASLEPKSSRVTNNRAHRITQSSSFSSTNHPREITAFEMAIDRLRAQHASQSLEFSRMAKIARARSCEEEEMVAQEGEIRPNNEAELQSPSAASTPKSSTVSSSNKHHATGNKNVNSSSHFAAGIGVNSRRQNQKRKGHAARCA